MRAEVAACLALERTPATAGMRIEMTTAIMRITTSSSMGVKARRVVRGCWVVMLVLPPVCGPCRQWNSRGRPAFRPGAEAPRSSPFGRRGGGVPGGCGEYMEGDGQRIGGAEERGGPYRSLQSVVERDICYFDGRCGLCRRTTRWLRAAD